MIDSHQRFEIRAKAFEMQTGLLAPGKDTNDGWSEEERNEAWKRFNKETHKHFTLFFYAADKILFTP